MLFKLCHANHRCLVAAGMGAMVASVPVTGIRGVEESRQASVELMGTADHTGCGIQHSLQFLSRRFRRACQDCVAVVNAQCDK